MMTAGREGEGGPVPGVEPPGGWSLAAPPEPPARSRRVQSSGSRCGSAPARSRRHSAARVPRPAGARYVLSPWRPPRSAGAGPPSSSACRAAPGGKSSLEPAPPRRCRPSARRGGEVRDRRAVGCEYKFPDLFVGGLGLPRRPDPRRFSRGRREFSCRLRAPFVW